MQNFKFLDHIPEEFHDDIIKEVQEKLEKRKIEQEKATVDQDIIAWAKQQNEIHKNLNRG